MTYPGLSTGIGMLVFTESNLGEFQVGYLALFRPFSVTHSFDWFQLMLMFLKASFLVLHLLYINDLPDDVFSNITAYADGTTSHCKCDQLFDVVATRIGE